MPRGGYIKITGSGATFVQLVSCFSYPAKGLMVWALCSRRRITLCRLLLPCSLILSGASYRTARRGRA